jgi:hypothetical protein
MSATLLLLAGAVPLADGGRTTAAAKRRIGGQELMQLVVREALDRILDLPLPPPGPPPNTPAGDDRSFSFPVPSPGEVAARVATSRAVMTVARDGNEAEDEGDSEVDTNGKGGRKRCRVLSFSGALASSRRVPHKRTRETVAPPSLSGDEADDAAVTGAAAANSRTKLKGRNSRGKRLDIVDHPVVPVTATPQADQPLGSEEQQQWRALGQELRGVALKFAMASSCGQNTAGVPRRKYSLKISAQAGGEGSSSREMKMIGGELSTNVVCLAVNFLIWRLLRRLFTAA